MSGQYVGIDLHRRRSAIVRMTKTGEVLSTVQIDNDPVALAMAIAEAGPDPEVALERQPAKGEDHHELTAAFGPRRPGNRRHGGHAAPYSLVRALRRLRTAWPIRCSFSIRANRT